MDIIIIIAEHMGIIIGKWVNVVWGSEEVLFGKVIFQTRFSEGGKYLIKEVLPGESCSELGEEDREAAAKKMCNVGSVPKSSFGMIPQGNAGG